MESMSPNNLAVLITAGVGGLILLGLLLGGLKNPSAWSLLSVLAIAFGCGLLVWGIVAAATGEMSAALSNPAIIGSGAGLLAGGLSLFIVALVRRRDRHCSAS